MGNTNRDASQITKRNRNKAENSYYNQWQSATNMGISATTRPTGAGATVLSEVKLGCKACVEDNGADPNQPRYPENRSSGGTGARM
jgi:hypothetical protein